jgi:hypothetical protein
MPPSGYFGTTKVPEIYVGLYLQNLMESAQHFSVIESAYYSIKWAHSLAGVNNPCDSEVITYYIFICFALMLHNSL